LLFDDQLPPAAAAVSRTTDDVQTDQAQMLQRRRGIGESEMQGEIGGAIV